MAAWPALRAMRMQLLGEHPWRPPAVGLGRGGEEDGTRAGGVLALWCAGILGPLLLLVATVGRLVGSPRRLLSVAAERAGPVRRTDADG